MIIGYIKLIRPSVCIMGVIALFIGAIVAKFDMSLSILYAVIAVFLICSSGNTINDYFDFDIDKVNKPNRPIPSGLVMRRNALRYYLSLSIIGLLFAFFVNPYFFGLALLNFFILTIYSWKLKKTALVGNLAVSWLGASTFLGGGLLGKISLLSPVSLLVLISLLGLLSREIIKDIEDIKGDTTAMAKTLPILWGEKKSKILSYVLLLIACILLFIPYHMALISAYYLIGSLPAIALCIYAIALHKKPSRSQLMIKVAMILILLGFLLGSLL